VKLLASALALLELYRCFSKKFIWCHHL